MKIVGYIALFLWLALGWKYCTDYKKGCTDQPILGADSAKECPICFSWSDPNPQLCENWESYRDSIVNSLNAGQFLVIHTEFNPAESNDAELGRNRAVSIKALFNGLLDEDRIQIQISTDDVAEYDNCKSKSWINVFTESQFIKENQNGATLYLDGKSIAANPELRGYLDGIAQRVKDSGETVRMTGHTDSDGSKVSNIKLGFNRAEEVKTYLSSLGVAKEKLITISKGENEPLTDNSTEESKAINRRIEINISKS